MRRGLATRQGGPSFQRRVPERPIPRLLLVDEDPVFCKRMEKAASRLGLRLAACSDLARLGTEPTHREFDLLVVEDRFRGVTGAEIACLFAERDGRDGGPPVLLVARGDDGPGDESRWPDCVRAAVAKSSGVETILELAVGLWSNQGRKGVAP